MLTRGEQTERTYVLLAKAKEWAEEKGFKMKKSGSVELLTTMIGLVQDGGPSTLSFQEMKELIDELIQVK